MSPTPSYAAALPAGDERNPHLYTRTALAITLGAYLTFFTGGIIRAIQLRDQVIPPTDYSTPASIAVPGRLTGEMGGAALLLYLPGPGPVVASDPCRTAGLVRALGYLPLSPGDEIGRAV